MIAHFFAISAAIIFSVFSTGIMSYISMAMPIGPWIAPTLLLFLLVIVNSFRYRCSSQTLILVTIAGSIGGILATGFGFSYPTIYFLDQELFNTWMADPLVFAARMSGIALSAGFFGVVLANLFEERLLIKDQLAFPVGQLIYTMASAQDNLKKAYQLMVGVASTALFGFLQAGYGISALIPKSITLLPKIALGAITIPQVPFDLWPMFWAIGFIAGHIIALPLAIGIVTNIFFANPLHRYSFSYLSNFEFILAFCSGMILFGVVKSFSGLLSPLKKQVYKKSFFADYRQKFSDLVDVIDRESGSLNQYFFNKTSALLFMIIVAFGLISLDFSSMVLLYLLATTAIVSYQIAVIAGKLGLAPLGRYATFVMVPAMLLFKIDMVQTVVIATFVEVCGGVTADVLFGRKAAQQAGIDQKIARRYQYLGLVVSCAAVGFIFWVLISYLGLGTPELFAYKAQSRQLLIGAQQFDWHVLIVGALFGWVLSALKVNAMMVLGGLLMPINMSVALVAGGFLSMIVANRDEWEPFWSGVFATDALITVLKAML